MLYVSYRATNFNTVPSERPVTVMFVLATLVENFRVEKVSHKGGVNPLGKVQTHPGGIALIYTLKVGGCAPEGSVFSGRVLMCLFISLVDIRGPVRKVGFDVYLMSCLQTFNLVLVAHISSDTSHTSLFRKFTPFMVELSSISRCEYYFIEFTEKLRFGELRKAEA